MTIALIFLLWSIMLVLLELAILFIFIFPIVRGAPFVATKKEAVEKIIALGGVREGDTTIDIGSGDGRIVIACARRGAMAHGYEINPLLVWVSKQNIKRAGLTKNAFIHWANFWWKNCSRFDVVTIYGMPHLMKSLERKLRRELKPGSRVVSNSFPFPTWHPDGVEGKLYLYRAPYEKTARKS